jgi:superoxide oxidase
VPLDTLQRTARQARYQAGGLHLRCAPGEYGGSTRDRRVGVGVKARARAVRTNDRYDLVTRVFHWVFATSIIYVSIAGYALGRIASRPAHDFVSRLNMSIATVLILLFPARVFWKFKRIEPRPLSGVTTVQRRAAHAVHNLMYAVILVVLLSGYLMVPQHYSMFGLFEIPTPFARGPLTDALFMIHRTSCAVLGGLVILHVLAVIKHQLVGRHDVLRRML